MEHLTLTVLGKNVPGVINELTKLIFQCECNIIDCRMMSMASEFAANILLAGNWNAIAKLETHLPQLEEKSDLHFLWARTTPVEKPKDVFPYYVYVFTADKIGVIHQITNFFAERSININDLFVESYNARYSGMPMSSITMSISIPDSMSISDLRESFLIFCDNNNFDGLIEPEKS